MRREPGELREKLELALAEVDAAETRAWMISSRSSLDVAESIRAR